MMREIRKCVVNGSLAGLFFLFILVAFSKCGTTPTPTPTQTDAGSVYTAACAHLAALGCQDGQAENCAVVLEQMVVGRLTTVSVSCLTGAANISAARACGGVSCP